jgi:hypothetical protein
MRRTYLAAVLGTALALVAGCNNSITPPEPKPLGHGPSLDISGNIAGCPAGGLANRQTSNRVGATATVNGNDVAYTFESFVTEGSGGIPGLIEYCVYSDTHPDAATSPATGADGSAWADPPSPANLAWSRPNGDPSNIPFDGLSHAMGTATWSSGVPANYKTILLHVNDAAECAALYPDGDPDPSVVSGTCFVLPGTRQINTAADLTASKDAAGTYKNTFAWTITKAVDKTLVDQFGGSATFNYTVTVTPDGGKIGDVKVTGTITVTNPNNVSLGNPSPVTIDGISDQLSDGTVCTVTNGGSQILTATTTNFSYSCGLGGLPSGSLTNTVTVTWSDQDLSNGTHLSAGSAPFTTQSSIVFAETKVDDCVNVADPNAPAGTFSQTCAPNTGTFTYSHSFDVPATDCKSYDNTATFTTNTTSTQKSASKTVTVCGPAKTGALTMGFWATKNGQAKITGGASTSGVCNSGTYLRTYAPFQDLGASATCSQVATYVSLVIKAASASGAAMNAMLKGQMLATALDVFFAYLSSSQTINLTNICATVVNPTPSTVACKDGITESVGAAFGGATSLTVGQILTYAASQSNVGGTAWYGQVKATQELAKDTFDAINNQLAFAF